MMKQIPPNFDEHWEGANVILRTQNSNGRELHVNKEELAAKSSYFNAMFFSGFKEAFQDYVNVPCDYKYMLNILRTIHESNTRGRLIGASTSEDLVEMYRIVDMLDFPLIKRMYIEHLDTDIDMITSVALKLENREMLAKCLEKMTIAELKKFIEMEHETRLFCKKDVIFVYKKITNTEIPKGVLRNAVSTKQETNVTIDSTKKWHASDLAISTRNSDGRLLYANKEVLSTFSENFHNVCTSCNESEIYLDMDYMAMKIILSLLQQSGFNATSLNTLPPVLLYDMYRIAKDMDIPVIRNLVSDRLTRKATAGCLEVIIKLDLQNLVPEILAKMHPSELRDWLIPGGEELIYRGNDEEVTLSSKDTDLTLSLNDLRCIFWKLHKEYAPRPPPEVTTESSILYHPLWRPRVMVSGGLWFPPNADYY